MILTKEQIRNPPTMFLLYGVQGLGLLLISNILRHRYTIIHMILSRPTEHAHVTFGNDRRGLILDERI